MAPISLTHDECKAAVTAFLEQHIGMVHRDDVGPLFGQLATLCNQGVADAATRKHWCDAVTLALTGDRRSSAGRQDFAAAAVASAASSRTTSAMSWT